MPGSSAGNVHRSPRRKSSFLSLRRGTRYSDIALTFSPPSSPQVEEETHFVCSRAHIPSSGREQRRSSPSGSPLEDITFPEKGQRPTKRTVEPPLVFPTLELDLHDAESAMELAAQLTPMPRTRTRSRSRKSSWNDSSPIPPLRFSGSSSQTQNESPPQTPIEATSRDRYPVVVAAPVAGVETMDALVDGMNGYGGGDYFSNGASNRIRFGIPGHHPLYQPPLPTPPPGVVLGGGKGRKKERKKPPKTPMSDDSGDENDEESLYTPIAPPRRRLNRAATTGSTTVMPSSPASFDDTSDTYQDESPQRYSLEASLRRKESSHRLASSRSSSEDPSLLMRSSGDTNVQRPQSSGSKPKTVVPSISEIIRTHAPLSAQVRSKTSPVPPSSLYTRRSGSLPEELESEPEPLTADEEAEMISRSSVDSIADEVRRTLRSEKKSQITSHALHHARSFPNTHTVTPDNMSVCSPRPDSYREPSVYSSSLISGHQPSSPFDPLVLPQTTTPNQVIAQYLRSTKLTTLLHLTRSPHASQDHPLKVSLSDLGDPNGFPLIVFLGLGCVRHVMGLYDEMADCLGLRLITIDRWGLGRTDEAQSRTSKGIVEWAAIVEEVLDLLHIDMCSIMAHSAGAPYALSFANQVPDRIVGDICLLAPWVGGGESGSYKWLKYVPNGILKTAQAAEWKIQAWMIGKPPTLAYEGIGYNATTVSSVSPSLKTGRKATPARQEIADHPSAESKSRPSIGSRSVGSSIFSEYDDLRDFDGRFESRSTLGARRDSMYGRTAGEGSSPDKKRKPSRGFLGKLKGTSSSQPQSSMEEKPSSGKRLKALRSMGSLKGKSSSAPSTISKKAGASSPQLPKTLVFDGLGFSEVDWTKSSAAKASSSVPPLPAKFSSQTEDSSPTSDTSLHSIRTGGRRSISFTTHQSSTPSALSISLSTAPSSPSSPVISSFSTPNSTTSTAVSGGSYQALLGSALIAASHAESARGTHNDLLQILNHDHKPWGFSYSSYPHKVHVWYGDRDEKIAENAVRWMERNMGEGKCSVKVVRGADHSLMYKSSVVVEVLERVREFW